jgi:hypothetical protein
MFLYYFLKKNLKNYFEANKLYYQRYCGSCTLKNPTPIWVIHHVRSKAILDPAFSNWLRRKASYMLNTCKSNVVSMEKQKEAPS